MVFSANPDGTRIKLVSVKDHTIGLLNRINVVSDRIIHSIAFYASMFSVRKGEVNDTCETDYQCHREIGLVCEQILGAAGKTCVISFH